MNRLKSLPGITNSAPTLTQYATSSIFYRLKAEEDLPHSHSASSGQAPASAWTASLYTNTVAWDRFSVSADGSVMVLVVSPGAIILRESLAPVILSSVERRGLKLKAAVPQLFRVTRNRTTGFLRARNDALNVRAFGATRHELEREVEEQLVMLWIEYAQEKDESLSSAARRVKDALLSVWEAVDA